MSMSTNIIIVAIYMMTLVIYCIQRKVEKNKSTERGGYRCLI